MISINFSKFSPFALTLAALLGCTIEKGGDEAGASSSSGTSSVGASETGAGLTTSGTTGDLTEATTEATTAPTTGSGTATTASTASTASTDTTTTGGETGTGEGNEPCIDTPTVLAPGDVSMGGFSGEQLLADKVGVRMTTLAIANEPTSLSPDWKGKQLPLIVELRHEGGEVRWIDSEVNPDWDDSGNESGLTECTDRMEIDVKLDFVTEAKEFDEHRDAVLIATTVDRAEVQAQLLPPGLMGSLDVTTLYTPEEPVTTVTGMWVFGVWQGAEAGGNVMHEINIGGDEGFAGFGPLGGWGDPIQP